MADFTNIIQDKPNDELLKMVYEFDQWNTDMLNAVQTELSKRNILPKDVAERKQKLIRMEDFELSKGKNASLAGQILGWLTVFGFLGIVIGYNYAYSEVRSKYTGKKYFKYNVDSRKNGSNLFYISILLSTIAILFRIIKQNGTNF